MTPAANIQLLLNLKTYDNGTKTLLTSFWNFWASLINQIKIKLLKSLLFNELFWMKLKPS